MFMHPRIAATALAVVILTSGGFAQTATLLDAVKAGDRSTVERLLTRKPDINVHGSDGTTALHWAVRGDDLAMTQLLVGAGADVGALTRTGVTPLALAAANGNAAIVNALLTAGANPNTASTEGETALMTAVRSGSAAAVKVLLARGADPNARENWQGQTALMWAAAVNAPAVVSVLVEAGADVNARSIVLPGQPRLPRAEGVAAQSSHSNFPHGGFTPLLFAAREGALDAARALTSAGVAVNLADPDGIAPLSMAIINAHYDLAALLIEKGANVNASDRVGRTPLFFATDMHTLEWLFSRPVPKASGELDSPDIVVKLLDQGANVNAGLTGRPFILHHNATGNRTLIEGSTAFMKATTTSDMELMRVLLAHGADPNIKTRNNTTPLMAAAGLNWVDISSLGSEEASIEAITLCLERGADINAANDLGETAMHGAAQRGADKVVRFLAAHGANLEPKDKQGRTPMDEAIGQINESDGDNVRRPERRSTQAVLTELIAAKAR